MGVQVFIDLENLVKSLERYIVVPSDFFDHFDRFLKNSFPINNSLYIRAYASWGLHSSIINYLHSKGVDIVYAYASKKGDGKVVKNLADMKIAVDIFESLIHDYGNDVYVLVSGDLDFLPVIFLLKKHGKKVWIVSDELSLSGALANAADKVFTYRDIYPEMKSLLDMQDKVDVKSLVNITLKLAYMVENMGYVLSPSILKELLTLHFKDFQEREWGFPNFKSFINYLEKQGYITMLDRNKMLLKLTDSGRNVAGEPYIPHEDYELAKELCEKEGLKGSALVSKLRKISGKKGIRGGKLYWIYIARLLNCLEEVEDSEEKTS